MTNSQKPLAPGRHAASRVNSTAISRGGQGEDEAAPPQRGFFCSPWRCSTSRTIRLSWAIGHVAPNTYCRSTVHLYMLLYQDARMHCHSLPLPSPPPCTPCCCVAEFRFPPAAVQNCTPDRVATKSRFCFAHAFFFGNCPLQASHCRYKIKTKSSLN